MCIYVYTHTYDTTCIYIYIYIYVQATIPMTPVIHHPLNSSSTPSLTTKIHYPY